MLSNMNATSTPAKRMQLPPSPLILNFEFNSSPSTVFSPLYIVPLLSFYFALLLFECSLSCLLTRHFVLWLMLFPYWLQSHIPVSCSSFQLIQHYLGERLPPDCCRLSHCITEEKEVLDQLALTLRAFKMCGLKHPYDDGPEKRKTSYITIKPTKL